MQGMKTKPNTTAAHACEFDALRAKMRKCVRMRKPKAVITVITPPRMTGVEVAYLALAEWLAAGGGLPSV